MKSNKLRLLSDIIMIVLLIFAVFLWVFAIVEKAEARPAELYYPYRLTAEVPFTTNYLGGNPSTTTTGVINSGIQFRIIRTTPASNPVQYTQIQLFSTWIMWVPTDQLQYEPMIKR